MENISNALGQPIGRPLPGWKPPPYPPREPLVGRFCRVEPLVAEQHANDLYDAYCADSEGRMWTYLAYGPFPTREAYRDWVASVTSGDDPLFHAIIAHDNERAVGVAAYLRITPAAGSIEIGHLAFAPALQRTPAASEALILMLQRAFDMGYRRYEWKCDALNAASRRAAERLGLSFEGVFRQSTVYKERNRDSAWYAAIDTEWPGLAAAYARWLDPSNFGPDGHQQVRLSELTRPLLHRQG